MKTRYVLTFLFTLALFNPLLWAQEQESSEDGVVYRYREYERFDFEDLVIEGETGGPGDLSITPRFQRQFDNKLPYRKNFNAEIRKAAERTR